jgi:uncharacterized protein YjcR
MHGGANGSGAPNGNRNALKHGTYTKDAFRQRAQIAEMVAEAHELLSKLR